MENKNNLPRTALALYVKLYCRRKKGRNTKYHNVLMEAIKSWVTLSKEEQQNFFQKHQEVHEEYKSRVAHYIKNAQLFMKKKKDLREERLSSEDDENENGNSKKGKTMLLHVESEGLSSNDDKNENGNSKTANTMLQEAESYREYNYLNHNTGCYQSPIPSPGLPELESVSFTQNYSSTQDHVRPVLPEPLEPRFLTGKDLYEMINENNQYYSAWTTLSQRDKRKYRTAVLSIKKEYIEKFKQYLENLTPIELFDCYNKKI